MKNHYLNASQLPKSLINLADPPKQLYIIGDNWEKLLNQVCLAVVGSRKASSYGAYATDKLVREAASKGLVIISGLALGIDGLAHKAALDAGGQTIAVLPCGLDRTYPSSHYHLAQRILCQGGALITEYPVNTDVRRENFIARNRLIAGFSKAVLIIEAAQKSGALHTANFALEQGKPVMAVPGNINSQTSIGTNNLIKAGATPVTSVQDIFLALGLDETTIATKEVRAQNQAEKIIIDLLKQGVTDAAELLAGSKLDTAIFNQTLTMLEITGRIQPVGGGQWILK